MKAVIIGASAILWLTGAGSIQADDSQPATRAAEAPAMEKTQTMCPVMNSPVNRKLFVDYEGKRIYVCCRSCVREVRKNPARYIAQLEKAGVILDKTPAAETPAK